MIVLALLLIAAVSAGAQQFSCSANVPYVPLIRAEGSTEHLGDVVLTCSGGARTPAGQPVPTVDFQLLLNTNVTSNQALLLVNDPASGAQVLCPANTSCPAGANVFQGVVAGANSVRFSGVPINPPGNGALTLRFANIRGDATSFAAAAPDTAPMNATATITASGGNAPAISSTPQMLAFLSPGLSVNVVPASLACPGGSLQLAATVNVAEAFSNSLQPRTATDPRMQSSPTAINGTESGLTLNGATAPGSIGAADFGTRFKLAFGSLPAGVTLFVPASIPSGAGGTAILTASETGPLTPVAPSNGAYAAVSGGLAVYEVTAANPSLIDSFSVPVYASYGSVAGVSVPIAVSFAPVSSVNTAGTAPLPRFTAAGAPAGAFAIPSCAGLSISPASLAFNFMAGNVAPPQTLQLSGSGSFTASSSSPWLSVSPQTGTAPAAIQVSVSPSLAPGNYSGSITIGLSVVPVTVAVGASGCVYTLNPASQSFGSNGGSGSFTITTSAGCAWTPTSSSPFITVTSGGTGNGNGTVAYSVAANSGGGPRGGTIGIAGKAFTISQSGTSGPTAVFHDIFGSTRLTSFGSTTIYNSGGVFGSDPGAAQNANGDTIAVERDNYGAIYINTFSASSQAWLGWTFAGGVLQGVPGIAITPDGTAWFAGRDSYGAYFLNSYSGGSFSGWRALGGVFSTDPSLAAMSDGSIYLIARDSYGGFWSGHYVPSTGFQSWVFGGGISPGTPSAAAGSDNAVYVSMRDPSHGIWMNRVQGNQWGTWEPAAGVMQTDPQAASAGNVIYASAVDASGGVWYNKFPIGTGNNWQGWTNVGGIMQAVSAAVSGSHLYLVGREASGNLWWQDTTGGGWMYVGYPGLPVGQIAAAPH
ncbi:MAG: hypothetical protein M3Z23_16240 [Acidobacteriota bacterium]|nr:hypothetical protein [Acidobacteriota bacterium]